MDGIPIMGTIFYKSGTRSAILASFFFVSDCTADLQLNQNLPIPMAIF